MTNPPDAAVPAAQTRPLRILIVHRYFWPDTAPAATILRSVAKRWTEDGHDVTVVSAQPDYSGPSADLQPWRERLDGTAVIRARTLPETKRNYLARSVNYAVVFGRAFGHAVRRRNYDVIVGLTAPPLIPGLTLGLAARLTGASFVYHCGDVYPELALRCGLMAPGWRSKVLQRLDVGICKRAARVNVLSRDMRNLMIERGVEAERITTINNLDLAQFSAEDDHLIPANLHKRPGTRRVLFAGNLGRFQSLPTVIEAARHLAHDESITFDFVGTGIARTELESAAGAMLNKTVFFHDRVSPAVAAAVAADADVALVTLRRGVISAAYPSKTMTYLRAGTPVLAMLEPTSELGEMVRSADLGRVVEPDDSEGFARAITELLDEDRSAMGQRCRREYEARFGRETLLDLWSDLAASLAVERG